MPDENVRWCHARIPKRGVEFASNLPGVAMTSPPRPELWDWRRFYTCAVISSQD
jgi:hypothetical protein